MSRQIEIVPYNPNWVDWFEEEAQSIGQALQKNCLAIHHVGSTAVPGLCAKSKIDIILVVKDTASLIGELEPLGYQYRGEFNIPFHWGFSKRESVRKVNLHVYLEGNPEVELNLLFRDFLRTHPEACEEYAALKRHLVSQKAMHEKKGRFSGYNLGKDAFIKRILEECGFQGLCMRFCTHDDEWEAARQLRQKYFFGPAGIDDPYTWTFAHKDHIHLVLYQGVKIVGYAHLQLWPEKRAALRIIVIDELFRQKGLGSHFLDQCERWLKTQGVAVLQTQSSPKAYGFYQEQAYQEMPFNDPDGYEGDPQDIDLGKCLI